MAHQYMAQLDPDIKSAVLGNAGTIISFRIGTEDAMLMAKDDRTIPAICRIEYDSTRREGTAKAAWNRPKTDLEAAAKQPK